MENYEGQHFGEEVQQEGSQDERQDVTQEGPTGVEDEDFDYVQGLLWTHHPVRELLLNALINKEIPTDHRLMKPSDVWNKYCDADIFAGMEYDAAFKRRLLALRKQVSDGKDRASADLRRFEQAKKNHPPPTRNHRDEPQWNGSEAQRLLKMDMDNKKHFDLKPEYLWESRPEYGEFYLSTFRDHLWQEHKTRKYLYTLKFRAKKKADERIADAKKKHDAGVARQLTAEQQKITAAEKLAEKDRKHAEKLAEKERKEKAKQEEKEKRAAEKLAERERKAAAKQAEKQAEKDRKAAAKAAAKKTREEEAKKLKEEKKLAAKKKKDNDKAAATTAKPPGKPKANKGRNKTKGTTKTNK